MERVDEKEVDSLPDWNTVLQWHEWQAVRVGFAAVADNTKMIARILLEIRDTLGRTE